MNRRNKYSLYECSVQSPDQHVEWLVSFYRDKYGRYARHLREDFCGTARISVEWVTRNKRNTATGLDLDREPLAYARKVHVVKLNKGQKQRLKLLNENVISVSPKKTDIISACNFSFYVFKSRQMLLEYFRCALRSLRKNGVLVLEMAGGPGMITRVRDRRTITSQTGSKFLYVWDQKSFDPITHNAFYAIHFKLSNGGWIRNAFTYDWRLWTIPEVRDAMKEAGFRSSEVYWETEHKGKGTGEYALAEIGDNAYAWIAYVVGVKD